MHQHFDVISLAWIFFKVKLIHQVAHKEYAIAPSTGKAVIADPFCGDFFRVNTLTLIVHDYL
jgi:hypothetical protein